MQRRVSIKDVAAHAGVSWKTVSNVVNERPVVSAGTRERVQRAIEELGYTPNHVGRDLRGGPTRTLALVVPGIENPYFARLAQRVQTAARRRGYSVSVEVTLDDTEVERRHVVGRSARPVDAVILSPSPGIATEILERRSGPRLVLVGESLPAGPDIVHVAIDNRAAVGDVVRHLLAGGRERLLFLGRDPEDHTPSTAAERLDGYRAALEKAGRAVDPDLIPAVASWDRADGYAAIESALAAGLAFDAVVAANDLLAVGALAALRDRGVLVPGRVAVVGWDDIDEGQYTVPPLSTIAPDLDALVEAVLDAALAPSTDGAPHEIVVPHRLIARESSGSGTG